MASRSALFLLLCCLIAYSSAQSVTVQFETTSYSVSESNGSIYFQVSAMFSADAPDVVTVNISGFLPPNAVSMDFDISGNGTQSLEYPIVDDNLLGNDLVMIEVMLTSIDPSVEVALSTATVNITEDDMVTIGFEQEMYSVYEGFDVEVCVNLSSGGLAPERTVVVTLSTDDVQGSGGMIMSMDYVPLSMDLTFSDTISNVCVNLNTIFNADANAMPFNVNLTTTEPTAVTLSPPITTINILDVVAPTIVTQPMDIENAFPDANVSFTVTAEGGALSYQWSRNGVEIEGATQATLTLVGVTIEGDEGTYSCFIYNMAGNITTNDVSLIILRRPNVTLEAPAGSLLNQEITLTCTAAVDAIITLMVVDSEGTNLTLTEVESTGNRRSVNVTVMNTGQHNVTCVADNNGLMEMKTVQFYGITIEVADVTAGITATAVFFCNVIGASGADNIGYLWTQSVNGVIPVNRFPPQIYEDRIIGRETPTLMIPNLSGLEQDFDYTCTFSISGMEIGSATGTLTSPGPMILVGPESQELQAGERLALNCTGQNNEDATMPLRVNWFFISFDSQNSQDLYNITDPRVNEIRLPDNITVNSFFVIDSVIATDGGVYGCQVSNRDGIIPVEQNASVTVFFTPQIRFTASPNPVPENGDPLLMCIITAEPSANFSEIVRILPDGGEQPVANMSNPTGDREFRVTSVLMNVKFAQDNRARFECRSSNANGAAEPVSIIIIVQAPPSEINHANDVTAVLASLDSVNVTWLMPAENNAPIQSYSLMFCARRESSCVGGTFTNVTLMVGSEELIMLDGNRLRYTFTQLLIGREYEVVIRAENSIGQQMSPAFGNGLRFNSAFPDDGRVVSVDSVSSTNTIILTWNLPPLALATNDLNVSFNVTYFSVSDSMNIMSVTVEYNPMRLEQGVSVDLMIADSPSHTFHIVALYTNPNLLSSQATLTDIRTLANDATLLGPEAEVTDIVSQNDVLTVSWPAPMNTNFLVAYRVSYTTSSARSRRQTPLTSEVPVGMTSTTLPFTAFTNFAVDVDAVYIPPNGINATVSLLPTTTFRTPERPSSPPLRVMAANESVVKIRLTWEAPTSPNGIITEYRIVGFRTVEDSFSGTVPANRLTYLSPALIPRMNYTFRVTAVNGFGDGTFSPDMLVQTNFSVVQPVISNTAVGDSGSPSFTIITRPFSDAYGGVGGFKVVVIRGSRVEPRDVPDSSLAPAGVSQFNYYVAYYGNARRLREGSGTTIIIGDNGVTNDDDGDIRFTNPPPEVGEDYYVFIRLYSTLDGTVFADSSLTGMLRINPPLDPAVIIAPIAVVAVVLLIILIVLLVVVFLFTRPRRGYTIAATGEDGVHRKKRGGALELRRTRLFSPVVNVPVPDVFTSAGQPTTLVCEASGTPAPEVVWTQNNEPLDKERFIQLADASLFINDTDLKDEGAYIVTATNSAGTAEQMVRVTVIRPSPPEPDPEHPPIQVGEFTEKIALLRANDDEGLEDEYSEVEPDITFTSYAAKININKNKNRYINIIPYDHSRVVLSLQDNTPGSDYINASYLDGFNRPNAYIATQGPQPSTFPDFWRMVWEFDCPTIVMVTNLKEEDKLKCHQYWPNYGTTTYGNIQVTLKGVENLAEYSIRTFHITPIAGQSRVQMPTREVKQFHFLVWPDHGVPQFATPLLSFRKRVAKYHPDKKGPMVVHCSAGVGRTGTFVTIDTMLRQMEAEGVIDIFNYVRHMRFRRNYMVQTAPQYVFIHDALLEAIMCGDNSIPAPELRKRFQDLMEVDPESNKSRLQLQFENLNSNSPQDDDFDSTIAGLPDNMAKNRFKVHLPANNYRVPLGAPPPRSEGGDDDDDEDEKEKEEEEPDYICASFADGYRQRNAFIITQAPMSSTTGDFWKMIWEQKSAAIVMLTELEEDGKEMSVKYWPGEVGEASLFGSFQLELSEDEKDKGDYVTRKFKLSHVDAPQDCRIVTQFHFTKWARSSTPKDTHSVIDLIDEIQRVQRKSGNQPITIHCDDGISRTGAFCTLYSVLERVKVDQVVDVYLATKTLRIQRAGLLETLDQYIFVHKAVIEFLDSFSDYQNFK